MCNVNHRAMHPAVCGHMVHTGLENVSMSLLGVQETEGRRRPLDRRVSETMILCCRENQAWYGANRWEHRQERWKGLRFGLFLLLLIFVSVGLGIEPKAFTMRHVSNTFFFFLI